MIPREVFVETLLELFAPVRAYLEDREICEVMINGPSQIYVERRGRIEATQARFASREALVSAIRNAAQFVGKEVDDAHPILEGQMPDGSRIEAVLPPAAPDGPYVAIRRFSTDALTVEDLVRRGAWTDEVARALRAVVASKRNVIVAGGTGSGKTSMLNALSSFIPPDERVVVLEDARELRLQRDHVCQLEARAPDASGRGGLSIRDLFRASLRLRPDRIVVGEIRGGEALDLVAAMTSGHGGCLSTLHATYPRDTLSRLETMAMMSDVELPLHALRAQIASAVDVVVQVARLTDGTRRVTHVTEVLSLDGEGRYQLQDLFVLERPRDGSAPALVATGASPACADELAAHGYRAARCGATASPSSHRARAATREHS